MILKKIFFTLLLLVPFIVQSQSGIMKGSVKNALTNESIPFANIVIEGTTLGVVSDIDGNYRMEGITPGIYNVICSSVGFQKDIESEITINVVKPVEVNFLLSPTRNEIGVVKIEASPFKKTEESPLSLRTISATEIFRSPGGNRDISKVVQSLPGVAASVSFRNDIIVRGGAPNENRFYLDGIEVPNINHFATQGSSGGPVGLINVNFIKEVDFYSGAFPASRGNALSSVIEFKQLEGNDEKLIGNFTLGSSDVGLTLDGPIGKKSSFILSARRSYLQLLFKGLGLPFLPTYNDFQFKNTIKLDERNKITILGLGAIDDFELNTTVNDDLTDPLTIERNNYILGNLPVNTQWNYTVGAKWTHFGDKSFQNYVVSRNHLNNNTIKYKDNLETEENLILDYSSNEIENKFRFEQNYRDSIWKFSFGVGAQNTTYTNSTFNKIEIFGAPTILDFSSDLQVNKGELFSQLSRSYLQDRLSLSLGLRTDFNDYSKEMSNPLKQLSPRFSTSYALTEKISLNFNIGRYFQLPAYTILGFRNTAGDLVNKENLKYIQSDHLVLGTEFNAAKYLKISVEGFYKKYDKYPFSTTDSISIANLGSDFGVIGNDIIESTSEGRSYGVEILVQQKLNNNFYGLLSYTFVKSEFTNGSDVYTPSAWDNRHILNLTAGYKLKKDWEVGAKFRLQGGSPYTPYDRATSAIPGIWDITNAGVFDYSLINSERLPISHALDIRIDKNYYFEKWALNAYIDIQNVYAYQQEGPAFITVERDELGNPIYSEVNPSLYQLKNIENLNGTLLPSIGIKIEF